MINNQHYGMPQQGNQMTQPTDNYNNPRFQYRTDFPTYNDLKQNYNAPFVGSQATLNKEHLAQPFGQKQKEYNALNPAVSQSTQFSKEPGYPTSYQHPLQDKQLPQSIQTTSITSHSNMDRQFLTQPIPSIYGQGDTNLIGRNSNTTSERTRQGFNGPSTNTAREFGSEVFNTPMPYQPVHQSFPSTNSQQSVMYRQDNVPNQQRGPNIHQQNYNLQTSINSHNSQPNQLPQYQTANSPDGKLPSFSNNTSTTNNLPHHAEFPQNFTKQPVMQHSANGQVGQQGASPYQNFERNRPRALSWEKFEDHMQSRPQDRQLAGYTQNDSSKAGAYISSVYQPNQIPSIYQQNQEQYNADMQRGGEQGNYQRRPIMVPKNRTDQCPPTENRSTNSLPTTSIYHQTYSPQLNQSTQNLQSNFHHSASQTIPQVPSSQTYVDRYPQSNLERNFQQIPRNTPQDFGLKYQQAKCQSNEAPYSYHQQAFDDQRLKKTIRNIPIQISQSVDGINSHSLHQATSQNRTQQTNPYQKLSHEQFTPRCTNSSVDAASHAYSYNTMNSGSNNSEINARERFMVDESRYVQPARQTYQIQANQAHQNAQPAHNFNQQVKSPLRPGTSSEITQNEVTNMSNYVDQNQNTNKNPDLINPMTNLNIQASNEQFSYPNMPLSLQSERDTYFPPSNSGQFRSHQEHIGQYFVPRNHYQAHNQVHVSAPTQTPNEQGWKQVSTPSSISISNPDPGVLYQNTSIVNPSRRISNTPTGEGYGQPENHNPGSNGFALDRSQTSQDYQNLSQTLRPINPQNVSAQDHQNYGIQQQRFDPRNPNGINDFRFPVKDSIGLVYQPESYRVGGTGPRHFLDGGNQNQQMNQPTAGLNHQFGMINTPNMVANQPNKAGMQPNTVLRQPIVAPAHPNLAPGHPNIAPNQPIVIMPGYASRPIKDNFEPRIEAILENIADKQGPLFNKLRKIVVDVLNIQDDVMNFRGRRGDQEYIIVEEMLTMQLLALDSVQSDGNEELRLTRKSVVRQVQGLIAILERKAKT